MPPPAWSRLKPLTAVIEQRAGGPASRKNGRKRSVSVRRATRCAEGQQPGRIDQQVHEVAVHEQVRDERRENGDVPARQFVGERPSQTGRDERQRGGQPRAVGRKLRQVSHGLPTMTSIMPLSRSDIQAGRSARRAPTTNAASSQITTRGTLKIGSRWLKWAGGVRSRYRLPLSSRLHAGLTC
mgnify:CR=1 FL=1